MKHLTTAESSSRQQLYLMGLLALGLLPAQSALAAPHRLYRSYRPHRLYRSRMVVRRNVPHQHNLSVQPIAPRHETGTSNAITNLFVIAEADGTRFIITGTDPFTPEIQSSAHPLATMITIPGQWHAGESGQRSIGQNGIQEVWFGASSELTNHVRIVANTALSLPCTTLSSPDHRRWEIKVWAPHTKPVPLTVMLIPGVDAAADDMALHITSASKTAITMPTAPAIAVAVAAAVPTVKAAVALNSAAPSAPTHSAAAPAATVIATTSAHTVVASNTKRNPARMRVPVASLPVTKANALGIYPSLLKPSLLKTPVGYASASKNEILAGSAPTPTRRGDDDEKRVSLDFIAADINDVLKALSLQSGINIVTGADVKGTITVSLNSVPMTEALDMVTRLSGFKYDRSGSAYVVGSPLSLDAFMKGHNEAPITEFIPYRYTSAAELTRTLTDRFPGINLPPADKSDVGISPSAPRLVVLTDSKERVSEVRAFIQRLEEARALPTVGATIEVYRVRYASAQDLVGILARLVPTISVQLGPAQGFQSGSNGASASYSSSSASGGSPTSGGPASPSGAQASGNAPQTLLLTGVPADIARAREVLTQVDVKTATLQFEAKVVDINSNYASKIGLTYDFNNSGTGVRIGERDATGQGAGTTGGTIQNNTTLGARTPNFGAIYRYPYSIGVQLEAVINNNKGRVLANPNLSALDGQPAVVFIGDQIKYVTNVQVTTTGTTIQTETAQVGVTLKVTGKSSPDGTITLYVHPEVSSVSSFLTLANGVSLPQIATRYVDTTIRVKDGETIGIGGLIRESDINNVQKVPILGDIPFFGQLFRRTDRTKDRSEVVIMITSRIQKD